MKALVLSLGIVLRSALMAVGDPAAPVRPNIVFILADDLGYGDLGCYGATDVRTPHLDRLAREGVRLTDFYANGPVCTPTRAAFMTGRYQQRVGGLEWAIYPGAKHLGLPGAEVTLAEMMREAGYATALAGKWHLGYTADRAPNAQGFERFFGLLSGNHNYFTHRENNGEADLWLDTRPVAMEGYSTRLITRHALDFLAAMQTRPFFLYLAYNAPHFPIQGPEDADRQVTLTEWAQGTRATYIKMVEALDAGIGEVLAALERHGLATNTLVVFTSDNGGDRFSRNVPLARGKGMLGEGGIRVPCLARWPGRIPAGKVSSQVGITMDWTATFLNLAGTKPPRGRALDGKDLLPILAGDKRGVKRTMFWRRVGPNWVTTHRAVREGNWKLILERNGKRELYDLSRDIGETNNLAEIETAKVGRLSRMLDNWEKQMAPPLYEVSRKPDQP